MHRVPKAKIYKADISCKIIAFFLLFLTLIALFISCRPKVEIEPPDKTVNAALQQLLSVRLQQPSIRVALLPDINPLNISAEKGFFIIDKDKSRFFPNKVLTKLVRVEAPGGFISQPSNLFTVQVASLSSKAEADRLAEEIETALKVSVTAQYNPSTGTYQVRAGRYKSRQQASFLAVQLNQLGYQDLWIATMERELQGKREIRVFFPSSGKIKHTSSPLIFVPRSLNDLLRVNQQSFRGVIEVFFDPYEGLQVINELHIEDYLFGVVPCEMSPTIFPELEALKAQAVAARTYAKRNMGQFASEGYDICSTSRCQVYKGYSAEQPLSNRAVEETKGIIATYNGEPIDALYTSTCGGHTENAEHIFGGREYPYLKGVECYPEKAATRDYKSSTSIELIYAEDGGLVNEEVALLVVMGVIPLSCFNREYLQEKANAGEIEEWTSRALLLLGKGLEEPGAAEQKLSESEQVSFAWLIDYLTKSFGWEKRAQLMISNADTEYLLADQQPTTDDSISRRNIALLFQEGIIAPFPYGSIYGDLEPSRALVLKTLLRLMNKSKPLPLGNGVFINSIEGNLELKIRGKLDSYSLNSAAYVFYSYGERVIPNRILRLVPGDKVSFHQRNHQIDFIKVRANLAGLADDRFSPYYRWESRRSREQLEQRIREHLPIGELIDLKPLEQGVSGRVVKLAVVGSKGEYILSGLKVRQLLGLRENLFLIEREYTDEKTIAYFNFIGKGWGHGVGLCQVGSFGMALRGADYKEILHHYYSGIKFKKLY